jgi:hypothetical protein
MLDGNLHWLLRLLPVLYEVQRDRLSVIARKKVPKWLTVDLVVVAEEIGLRGLVRERVHDLLSGPVEVLAARLAVSHAIAYHVPRSIPQPRRTS